ncbi:MAG TPA: thiol:disulfide interchange protein DsbA/DsbL [Pseudomonadales bacterium]|nr:thiol:disulfide interchange protein DsbA/DsbL [Pseudomonadales bacterium]
MFKTLLRSGFFTLFLFGIVFSVQAETFKEGVDYELASTPGRTDDPAKIEVREFFWYGCPHCYKFEPYIEKWLTTKADDVVFVRTPGVMNKAWEVHGKAFYAAKSLGILEQSHRKLFDAVHANPQLKDQDQLAEFYTQFGVSAKDFNKTYESFGVTSEVRQADALARSYQLMGVPAIIVNGKYVTNGRMSADHDRWLQIVDFLVEKERQAKK